MSEHPTHDPQLTPQGSAGGAARNLASARRRRFIKLGSAAVPTALTLASRPVMAWHCNTASTWGSAQGASKGQSSYTRANDASRLFPDETYTLQNWRNNTTRAGLASNPWRRLNGSISTSDSSIRAYFKYYTVAQLLGNAASIVGVNPADSVWSILNGKAQQPVSTTKKGKTTWSLGDGAGSLTGDFQKLMLVAWLNFKTRHEVLVMCLAPNSTNALVAFGNLSYRESDSRPNWTQAQIIEYLQKNWIAVKY